VLAASAARAQAISRATIASVGGANALSTPAARHLCGWIPERTSSPSSATARCGTERRQREAGASARAEQPLIMLAAALGAMLRRRRLS